MFESCSASSRSVSIQWQVRLWNTCLIATASPPVCLAANAPTRPSRDPSALSISAIKHRLLANTLVNCTKDLTTTLLAARSLPFMATVVNASTTGTRLPLSPPGPSAARRTRATIAASATLLLAEPLAMRSERKSMHSSTRSPRSKPSDRKLSSSRASLLLSSSSWNSSPCASIARTTRMRPSSQSPAKRSKVSRALIPTRKCSPAPQ
mmetsp:Transcript_50839/g.146708  ORF Transcript_50839/g.146708 Transcript_50839/m.146708 type:complete len:208 (+) Transcript_50839:751-1374(+)